MYTPLDVPNGVTSVHLVHFVWTEEEYFLQVFKESDITTILDKKKLNVKYIK